MSDEFADYGKRRARSQVMGDEGMTKIVHFGVLNPRDLKVPVNCSADISHKKGFARLGDKKMRVITFGSNRKPVD